MIMRAYRVARPAGWSETAFGRARVFEWKKIGCEECATRTVWVDGATGRLVKVEEKTADGFVFRSLAWQGAPRPATPKAGPTRASACAAGAGSPCAPPASSCGS